ncbi:MAG: mechanosensitive ion channel family protein [Cyanobacteriota bacterium]|nr:mechanosensitive ion channel family protein [Cyanobacteriota bacterium]
MLPEPSQIQALIVPFLFKIAGAIALWVVGGWVIGFCVSLSRRSLLKGGMQSGLVGYLASIIGTTLRVLLLLAILSLFGIQTTSFAALIAGAGLAIGAAVSGLLGNFAAGAFLQGLRPFKVGDYVLAGGVEGTVEEVGMLVTTILTPDSVRTMVPNGKLFGDTLKNFSSHPFRRVELVAQLDHSADVGRAIELLKQAVAAVPNQAPGQPADVEVLEFSERGPRLAVRPYTHTAHYWQVYFDTNRVIADVLAAHGFPVPRIPVQMASAN